MIELNSVFVVLMTEALAGLVLLVLGFLFITRKKSSGEQIAASKLIDKLEDTENIKAKQLQDMITESCNIAPDEVKELLNEISSSERVLYQQIIQMFLSRDIEMLNDMDQYIDGISEPYCKIIRYSSGNTEESNALEVAEDKIESLMQQTERLGEQLTVSMKTMDEISAEYTRVFSGTQTELELENSSKKMFSIFQDAEQRIKDSFKDKQAEEL
jgi:hypothetical protein